MAHSPMAQVALQQIEVRIDSLNKLRHYQHSFINIQIFQCIRHVFQEDNDFRENICWQKYVNI